MQTFSANEAKTRCVGRPTRGWRPKFDPYLSVDLRRRILLDLQAAAYWAGVPPEWSPQAWCRDPDNDPFIRLALASGAGWLVTGDQALLDVGPLSNLAIVIPAAALSEARFCPDRS